jgi:hypothetical protein
MRWAYDVFETTIPGLYVSADLSRGPSVPHDPVETGAGWRVHASRLRIATVAVPAQYYKPTLYKIK